MKSELRSSTSRREWMRYVALTLIGVPAMKAASIARDESRRLISNPTDALIKNGR